MHTLHLLHHAKSSHDQPELGDRERPLAPRGERASALLRDHATSSELRPELVLCSSAVRTRQTLAGIRAALPTDAVVELEDDLYGATASELLVRLRRVDEPVGSVLVVGHNPGIEDLARDLVAAGDRGARERLAAKYPTGGLATLRFEAPWAELAANAAELRSFVVPRELG